MINGKINRKVHLHMLHIIVKLGQPFLIENVTKAKEMFLGIQEYINVWQIPLGQKKDNNGFT